MLLAIDTGNTFIKCAVYEKDTLIWKTTFQKDDALVFYKKIFSEFPKIDNIISSSVGKTDSENLVFLQKKARITEITHNFDFPFENLYDTPATLGTDRMVLSAGAALHFPNQNVLVIDAGTCVTYDFIDEKACYHGGAISPGLRIRYQSLHDYTAKLPLLNNQKPIHYIGKSTNESIYSGVVNGLLYEIQGFITQYKNQFKTLTIILTGGNAEFLAESLKNDFIFARPNFLLESLNLLYIYQSNND